MLMSAAFEIEQNPTVWNARSFACILTRTAAHRQELISWKTGVLDRVNPGTSDAPTGCIKPPYETAVENTMLKVIPCKIQEYCGQFWAGKKKKIM